MRNMELLAPAGGMEQLKMAVHFGADAVYLAGERWGMRRACANFSPEELAEAVAYAHGHDAAVHVTVNTLMRDADFVPDALPTYLAACADAGVDAFIMADLGAIALAREVAPGVAVHLSTQASCMNARAAEAYARMGVTRIVLAREMTLAQIAELRRAAPAELELEAFVHGSACMAYSGRCLLSAELMGEGRSASFGACAQPCRWSWELVESRSGARVPLEADERGSYLLSSNDICMIDHLSELAAAGVDALKVEGRAKGSYYVACVTNAYRHVLGGEPAAAWAGELDLVSHRPYSTGFFLGEPTQNPGRVGYARERRLVAVVEECEPLESADGGWMAIVTCRNKAEAGARVQVLSPGAPIREFALEDDLVTNGATYRLRLPFAVAPLDVLCA